MNPLYEVEWISNLPTDAQGDSDFECATYSTRRFPSNGLARAFAVLVACESPIGCAQVRRIEEVSWADCDDGELSWWIEKGKRLAFIGEPEEVDGSEAPR